LDSSLVAIKSYAKYFHLLAWAQGQVTCATMAKNLFYLWRHPQRKWNPKPKICFQCRLEDSLSLLRVWTAL